MRRSIALGLLALVGIAPLAACEEQVEPPIVLKKRCTADSECEAGHICIDGDCIPKDALSCQTVEGGKAILQPGPSLLDFGYTGSGTALADLILRNIGDCTLTIYEAYLEKGEESPFVCPKCDEGKFLLELFPFRDHQMKILFTPGGVGEYEDYLILLSDDAEFSEIKVPLRARFDGIPKAAVAPSMLDFDYAPVGRTVAQQLKITNQGDGTAPLEILDIKIETATASAFSFEPEFIDPITVKPTRVDRNAALDLRVKYHPKEIEGHEATLVITTNQPRDAILRVPLIGSSKTPAKIKIYPESIRFGPVPIGQSTPLPLNITNEGGTPLKVKYRWGGTGLSTDLSALPQIVPPVAPGAYTDLQVLVTATSPSPITGLLLLETNDPSRPSVTVPVSAEGQDVVGAQVVKIEMNFENGSDSFFDDDFRNVDLALESPYGHVCNKQNPRPQDWMNFGHPSWLAFGPKEEPERVVLPDAMQDGTYRVILNYVEDCSSVPSGIVAAVLGISVDALIAYLTGGITGGTTGGQVSDAIERLCLNHSSSAVTVTVTVNGQVVDEVPATLGQKGDLIYALDLIRQNGQYTVRR